MNLRCARLPHLHLHLRPCMRSSSAPITSQLLHSFPTSSTLLPSIVILSPPLEPSTSINFTNLLFVSGNLLSAPRFLARPAIFTALAPTTAIGCSTLLSIFLYLSRLAIILNFHRADTDRTIHRPSLSQQANLIFATTLLHPIAHPDQPPPRPSLSSAAVSGILAVCAAESDDLCRLIARGPVRDPPVRGERARSCSLCSGSSLP